MSKEYKFPVDQCDIPLENRPLLESFRAKRGRWLDWIEFDEHHAIWSALSRMAWRKTAFQTMMKFAMDDESSCLNNPLIEELLISGLVNEQILAVRRLMDKRSDVISLRRLLNEIKNKFDLFTRENYVCFDGLPYDYMSVGQRVLASKTIGGFSWADTSGPNAYNHSKRLHEQFDRLSGICPEKRERNDRLPIQLIETIESWMNSSGGDELSQWSHSFLAHAGGPDKRALVREYKVKVNDIEKTFRDLCRVTEAISALLLSHRSGISGLVPTAQFNKFEKMTNPAVRRHDPEYTFGVWEQISSEIDQYCSGVEDDLVVLKT